MSFQYMGYTVRVYQQHHKDYPPWVATVQVELGGKVRMFNVEGQSADDAAERARKQIDKVGV